MFVFFLVDDDPAQRSNLRRFFPWERSGFSFAGEASDGELALPTLRFNPPDLLIADLHMPFLDGLELCRLVRREMPQTKLLLIGSNATAEELQKALELGVDCYLPKPLESAQLRRALNRLRRELEEQQQVQEKLSAMEEHSASYVQFLRDQFFSRLVSGTLSLGSAYEEAKSLGLGIELRTECYSFLLCYIRSGSFDAQTLELMQNALQELKLFFQFSDQFHSFARLPIGFSVLVLGSRSSIEREVAFGIQSIRNRMAPLTGRCRWVVASPDPINRFSALPDCYARTYELIAWSYLLPEEQVLTPQRLQKLHGDDLEARLRTLPTPLPLAQDLELFFETGLSEQAEEFARRCASSMGEGAMDITALCLCLLLRVRAAAVSYVHSLSLPQEELLSAVDHLPSIDLVVGRSNVVYYLTALLRRAVELRERVQGGRYHEAVQRGIRWIQGHLSSPELNLSQTAKAAGISPNYFSTLFRQELGVHFAAYVTQLRMEQATELLRTTDLPVHQVGLRVGYQNARYFSSQFRQNVGCTPLEYRARESKRS